jgi:hypothetical protein
MSGWWVDKFMENYAILPSLKGISFKNRKAVGRESKAHPAFCIIPSLDAERYHLPPIQGFYRYVRSGIYN